MIEYYDEHGEPKISELDWTDDDQWTANRWSARPRRPFLVSWVPTLRC